MVRKIELFWGDSASKKFVFWWLNCQGWLFGSFGTNLALGLDQAKFWGSSVSIKKISKMSASIPPKLSTTERVTKSKPNYDFLSILEIFSSIQSLVFDKTFFCATVMKLESIFTLEIVCQRLEWGQETSRIINSILRSSRSAKIYYFFILNCKVVSCQIVYIWHEIT